MLGSFLFNITGSYLLFTLLEKQNTSRIAIKIDNNGFEAEELIDLKIKTNDQSLIFIEDNEFIYNGLLFDIIELKSSRGYYEIKAYWDKREQQLEENFIAQTKQQHQPEKSNQTNISIKLLLKDYTPLENTSFTAPNFNDIAHIEYRNTTYSNPPKYILVPPPRQGVII